MTQNPKLLAAGLVGGYLLGRTRKAKVALAIASFVVGRRKGLAPQQLLAEGAKKLSETPEFARLNEQLRGELMSAGRSMVAAAANRRLDSLSDALRDRTDALSAGGERAPEKPGGERSEEEQPEREGPGQEQPEQEEPDQEEPEKEEPEKERPSGRKAAPKKSSSKQAGQRSTAQSAAKKSTSRSTRRR